jgi:hypothetical protein
MMDNFTGVHAMMKAYFSGAFSGRRVACQVTYGEESTIDDVDFYGAREVAKTLITSDCILQF